MITIPVLMAFEINGGRALAAWCPFCAKLHIHGAGDSDRAAHCEPRSGSPFLETGYELKTASQRDLLALDVRSLRETCRG